MGISKEICKEINELIDSPKKCLKSGSAKSFMSAKCVRKCIQSIRSGV